MLNAKMVLRGSMWTFGDGLQVYACLAEQLPEKVCHVLLGSVLEGMGQAAADDASAAWGTAEAMCVVEAAAALACKTGSAAQLAGVLLTATLRCANKNR